MSSPINFFLLVISVGFLLNAAGPVSAQAVPPVTSAVAALSPKLPTQADTVAALHRLFQRRRVGGGVLLSVSGATVATFMGLLSSEEGFGPGTDVVLITAVSALYTAPFWSVGASKLVRFSRKREQQVIDEFVATRELPAKIRRRLKPAYFR
ncbi:hypothetical protein LGH70_16945 [Hymenobacter sp. BT635]|uniref:DUF4199 domain-containing protein n=1 Tax=Hymenobacter nitidus TaxID=2880929 RepID=A0ABS8AHY0_9BACT|nr:hypothetical protein [Hymenobacter nitidus]MCB2379287.1 hypothetical protein [Hymenobacter nitidus]